MKRIAIDFSDLIANPALSIDSNLFQTAYGHNPQNKSKLISNKRNPLFDIKLDELPPSQVHPATRDYFMVDDYKIAPLFDSTTRHPAFFNASYFRGVVGNSRHINNSLAVCKIIHDERMPGNGK